MYKTLTDTGYLNLMAQAQDYGFDVTDPILCCKLCDLVEGSINHPDSPKMRQEGVWISGKLISTQHMYTIYFRVLPTDVAATHMTIDKG